MAKDPICGMYVEEKPSALRQDLDGIPYYFCCKSCMHEFTAPEKKLKKIKMLVTIGILLAIPITFLTYVDVFAITLNHYVLFLLTTPVQFWIGWRFYQGTFIAQLLHLSLAYFHFMMYTMILLQSLLSLY